MEKTNYTEIIQAMAQVVGKAVKEYVQSAKFDQTFKAVVTGKLPNGKYQVLYNGRKYTASSKTELNINDVVRVCAPQNDWSDLFIL